VDEEMDADVDAVAKWADVVADVDAVAKWADVVAVAKWRSTLDARSICRIP